MTLYRGVYPINFDLTQYQRWEVIQEVLTLLKTNGAINPGEQVILTRGDITGISGEANSMKIVRV